MRLEDAERVALNGARENKERVCREGPADIGAMIAAFRGEDPVALVKPRRHIRDELLTIFRIAAVGFDADLLSMTFETWVSVDDSPSIGKNPMTGEPWRAGEMQDLALNHNGIEKGWVSECVSVMCANRAGDVSMIVLPYHYIDGRLVWDEVSDLPRDGHASGLMPKAMRYAMKQPSASTLLPGGFHSASRAQRDVITSEILGRSVECIVVLVTDVQDQERLDFLRQHGEPLAP